MNKWDKRFMEMAEFVATWSSCYQDNRQIGAIIVRDKRIITTGYNGAPAGMKTCKERKECLRRIKEIPSGTHAEYCYAVHAEQNAIAQAAKLGSSVEGATMYVTHQPCVICAKLIVNSGIKKIIFKNPYPDELAEQILKETDVSLINYDDC